MVKSIGKILVILCLSIASVGSYAQKDPKGDPKKEKADKQKRQNEIKAEYHLIKGMGKLLLELADEIPPVVVNPGRPQAIFLMKENFFSAAMYGSLSPKDTITQMREAMKSGFGGPEGGQP